MLQILEHASIGYPLLNEVDSSLEDLVSWAMDLLALLETELDNFVVTTPFGMLSLALNVSLSFVVVKGNFTEIKGILQNLRL